ncbi:MAG: tetratricopeptide repeat protein [Cyanobacteria bacterium SZAS TMP-1]|nr:tetratricopeptide repeat protein [Cyanobacteria bacterium SZAS TMP-1]
MRTSVSLYPATTDDAFVAAATNDIGLGLAEQGQAQQAQPFLEKALAMRLKIYGADDRWVNTSLRDVFYNSRSVGETRTAIPAIAAVVNDFANKESNNSEFYIEASEALAALWDGSGRKSEAEKLLIANIERSEIVYGTNNSATAAQKVWLAALRLERGEKAEAPDAEQVLLRTIANLGEDNPEACPFMQILGRYYGALGASENAGYWLLATVEATKDSSVDERPRLCKCYYLLSKVYFHDHQYLNAQKIAEQLYSIELKRTGRETEETARIQHLLGEDLLAQSKYPEARKHFDSAYKTRLALLGESNSLTQASRWGKSETISGSLSQAPGLRADGTGPGFICRFPFAAAALQQNHKE